MNELYTFEEFLKDHVFRFKSMRYETDRVYQAVYFHKYGYAYKRYCVKKDIRGDYDAVHHNIKAYDVPMSDGRHTRITY